MQQGQRHLRHKHDYTQVSFLLAGGMLEDFDDLSFKPGPGAVGLKPAGVAHSDQWGPEGVLIFSIRLRPGEMETAALNAEPGWADSVEAGLAPALVRTLVSAPTEAGREEALWDMLSLPRQEIASHSRPPPWLARARAAIHDAPETLSVAEAADYGGVHRVYFSRLFRRHFGAPPSVYRRRLMVSRAVARAVRSPQPLSHIALDAGFSDQAHLSRVLRAEIGLPPAFLRSLFRTVTSVQEQSPWLG
jgi:AraC family transcriptional regulator